VFVFLNICLCKNIINWTFKALVTAAEPYLPICSENQLCGHDHHQPAGALWGPGCGSQCFWRGGLIWPVKELLLLFIRARSHCQGLTPISCFFLVEGNVFCRGNNFYYYTITSGMSCCQGFVCALCYGRYAMVLMMPSHVLIDASSLPSLHAPCCQGTEVVFLRCSADCCQILWEITDRPTYVTSRAERRSV